MKVRTRAKAVRVRCMGREWLAVDVGKTLIIEDERVDIRAVPLVELIKQWRYNGCEVDESSIEVRIYAVSNKRLVELPNGYVIPI